MVRETRMVAGVVVELVLNSLRERCDVERCVFLANAAKKFTDFIGRLNSR